PATTTAARRTSGRSADAISAVSFCKVLSAMPFVVFGADTAGSGVLSSRPVWPDPHRFFKEERRMHWTRRWGIIGAIALAQLGAIVTYQAFLTGGAAPANAAQTAPEKSTEAPAPPKAEGPAPTLPAIPLPTSSHAAP